MSNNENKNIPSGEKEEISTEKMEPTVAAIRYSPRVDIYETTEAVTLVADLPGVALEDLSVNVEEGQLSITGLVKDRQSKWRPVHMEYGIGGYTRDFKVSQAVDASRITAALKDGVLTLTMPRSDKLKPRKIEITAA